MPAARRHDGATPMTRSRIGNDPLISSPNRHARLAGLRPESNSADSCLRGMSPLIVSRECHSNKKRRMRRITPQRRIRADPPFCRHRVEPFETSPLDAKGMTFIAGSSRKRGDTDRRRPTTGGNSATALRYVPAKLARGYMHKIKIRVPYHGRSIAHEPEKLFRDSILSEKYRYVRSTLECAPR